MNAMQAPNFFTYIRKYDSNRRRAENDTTAPAMPEFLHKAPQATTGARSSDDRRTQ